MRTTGEEMMERHQHVEINEMKETLLRMAGMVEAAIDRSIRALLDRDVDLAARVVTEDQAIDRLEIEVEEQCISILARHQPVAVDLRLLFAAVKMNNDLERIGDHAVNIARRVERLPEAASSIIPDDMPRIAETTRRMIGDALDAFVNGDVAKARSVCVQDDEVDRLEYRIQRKLIAHTIENPGEISRAMALAEIARNFERIADISTNICEEVIFMVEAKTIKHHFDEGGPAGTA
jgi:phosphate transport system protein